MKEIMLRCLVCFALSAVSAGCTQSEDSEPPACLKADLVPLKIVMTDYISADGGSKLIMIKGSASYVVPFSALNEPSLEGKRFTYHDLPCPRLDVLSLRIDEQSLLINERGLFTSRREDSVRINELRAEAMNSMKDLMEGAAFVEHAKKNTQDALRAFYEKFDGYSCDVKWK